jgi:hypothetical protein
MELTRASLNKVTERYPQSIPQIIGITELIYGPTADWNTVAKRTPMLRETGDL